MKIYKNIEQGSEEWFKIRELKATASHAQAIGNSGKGLETYVYDLVAEHYSTGEKVNFTNEHTERGNELEEVAREMYKLETGDKVEEAGFIEMNEFIGASPDGLIGEDGGLEIKCVEDKKYFKMLIGAIDPVKDYDWQIQMSLLVSERKYWQLVIYNPNFKKNMIITKVLPDPVKQEKLKVGLAKCERMIKELIEKYNKIN